MPLKILLVNSNLTKPAIAPIGLDYLGTALRQRAHEVELLDLCFERDPDAALRNHLSNARGEYAAIGITVRNTDDCCFSTQHSFVPAVAELVACAKELSSSPVVLGGCGFSTAPEAILERCGADFGIVGDGEEAFAAWLEASGDGGARATPGLMCRDGSRAVSNPPSFADLSALSLAARDVVDNARYFREGGQAGIETKRGCAQSCVYCADPVAKGRSYRLRSPVDVVDEIENLVAQSIDHLHVCDSEFNLPEEHCRAVLEEIARRNLGGRLRWYAYASPVPFDDSLADLMVRAGCAGIDFGVDSGSEEMLASLGRSFGPEDVERTAATCRRHGIVFMYDLLLGGPGENARTVRETISLMKRLKPSRVGVAIGVRLYRGTPLARRLAGAGGIGPHNPNLRGSLVNNESLLEPVFYLSESLGDRLIPLVGDLVGPDQRFFFADAQEGRNYNYDENTVLVEAVATGYRGAYWDILRRLADGGQNGAERPT